MKPDFVLTLSELAFGPGPDHRRARVPGRDTSRNLRSHGEHVAGGLGQARSSKRENSGGHHAQ
jgi:hypothetical protein